MSTADVTVDLTSIRRAWRKSGHGAFWIQLRTKDGDLRAFAGAVDETNEHFEEQDFDGPFGGVSTESRYGLVVELSDGADDARLEAWLNEFATRLAELGLAGTLQAASTETPSARAS